MPADGTISFSTAVSSAKRVLQQIGVKLDGPSPTMGILELAHVQYWDVNGYSWRMLLDGRSGALTQFVNLVRKDALRRSTSSSDPSRFGSREEAKQFAYESCRKVGLPQSPRIAGFHWFGNGESGRVGEAPSISITISETPPKLPALLCGNYVQATVDPRDGALIEIWREMTSRFNYVKPKLTQKEGVRLAFQVLQAKGFSPSMPPKNVELGYVIPMDRIRKLKHPPLDAYTAKPAYFVDFGKQRIAIDSATGEVVYTLILK